MKTSTACIDCFIKQAKNYTQLLEYSSDLKIKIIEQIKSQLKDLSTHNSPPEIAYKISKLILNHSDIKDPYSEIKAQNNKAVIKIYSQLQDLLNRSPDRLLKALELAIAGNIIDFGAKHDIKIEDELSKIITKYDKSIKNINSSSFNYKNFYNDLQSAQKILYLGDNCGEIVFDKLFIEEILKKFPQKKITFVVRNNPIINDATYSDAKSIGLTNIVKVISSGCNTPGTILEKASDEFLLKFQEADLILSKGQGNFEALSDLCDSRIYYLFTVKCEAVANHINALKGDIILKKI